MSKKDLLYRAIVEPVVTFLAFIPNKGQTYITRSMELNKLSSKAHRKKVYLTLSISVVLIVVVGLSYAMSANRLGFINLSVSDWSHFPNAEITGNTVHIKPIERVITHKDTSAAQPNPPVNIRGSHLDVSGDFEIKMSASGITNGVTFQLFGQVPNIYDEWRQERASTSIETTSNGLRIRVWDGTSPSSVDERIFNVSLKDNETFIISHIASSLVVRVNSVTLGDIPDHNIFSKGTIWFGADANLGTDGWSINSLKVRNLGNGRVSVAAAPNLVEVNNQSDTLRKLSATNPRHIPIGAAIAIYPLLTDEHYRNIALSQFSIMTPENSMKPQFIHPQQNLYTFQDADGLVEAAQANHMLVHGHALLLDKANPQWMQSTPKSQRQQVMTDHITNVVSHFKGKVAEWDVVNEPLSGDDIDYTNGNLGIKQQMWSEAMGESYIDAAFRVAHAADPAAKLYLNDFGMENNGKRFDAMVALIQRLQARGVPIDGVGFEAHVYHDPADIINPDMLRQHIQTLAALGIVSRISEIDVLGDKANVQAEQYSDILKACLDEPTCTSYTTWGVSDLYGSTTTSDRYPAKLGDSLLWDSKYVPKTAFKSLQNVLKGE